MIVDCYEVVCVHVCRAKLFRLFFIHFVQETFGVATNGPERQVVFKIQRSRGLPGNTKEGWGGRVQRASISVCLLAYTGLSEACKTDEKSGCR